MHLLIATDGSEIAVHAAGYASGLFKEPDRITLLNVLTSVPGEHVDEFDEPVVSAQGQEREWEVRSREAEGELGRTGAVGSSSTIERRVEAGEVAGTIVRVASEVEASVSGLSANVRNGSGGLGHH